MAQNLLSLFGIRFVSKHQPLGSKLAIQALIFLIRHPQRPLKALRCLGAKVLRLRFGLRRRMHDPWP